MSGFSGRSKAARATGLAAFVLMLGAPTVAHAGTPGISVSRASIDFGAVTVGQSTPAHTVTVTSTGTANLTISKVSVPNDQHPAQFPITADTCTGASLAPGASCTFQISFAPWGW